MTTVESVNNELQEDIWAINLVLKDVHWHVQIHPRLRRFTAVQVGKETWQFRVMPLRLSLVLQIFNRLISAPLARLTLSKWQCWHISDFLIVAESKEECVRKSHIQQSVFQEAGLIISLEKLYFVLEQKFTLLRINWCSQTSLLCLLADKALAFTETTAVLLDQRVVLSPVIVSARKNIDLEKYAITRKVTSQMSGTMDEQVPFSKVMSCSKRYTTRAFAKLK